MQPAQTGLAKSSTCDCDQQQIMNHIVEMCPLKKFVGRLQLLHEAEHDAVKWLKSIATTAIVKLNKTQNPLSYRYFEGLLEALSTVAGKYVNAHFDVGEFNLCLPIHHDQVYYTTVIQVGVKKRAPFLVHCPSFLHQLHPTSRCTQKQNKLASTLVM